LTGLLHLLRLVRQFLEADDLFLGLVAVLGQGDGVQQGLQALALGFSISSISSGSGISGGAVRSSSSARRSPSWRR
jgi:hypothetical protein